MSSDAAAPPAAGTAARGEVAETELAAGALGFWGNMVQAVTHIAPGLNVLLGLTFIVSFVFVTAPLAYLFGGLICLGVAIVLTQLAKEFTGAGGYFLYISRTLGPRLGWLTTWLYFLYDPVAIGVVCAFTGSLVHDTLQAQYGWNIPWWVIFAVLVLCVTVFTLFGISLSVKVMLALMLFEIGIFLVLMVSGMVSPGKGGFNFSSYNPSNIPSGHAMYLGIVFTILALSGFESVAPLGEETENPKRNLPLAIIGSTIVVALFYMLVNWGVLLGEGTDTVKNFTSSTQVFDLARRLWGGAWILLLIAVINSALAVCIAIQNATTRVLFDMGRVGALPPVLSKVHPRWKTPWNAIWFLTAVTLILGLGLATWLGPVTTFGMIGIMQTLALIIVYCMGNIGAIRYYFGEKRDQFNWFLHGVIPVVTTIALGAVFYENVKTLHPFSPKNAFDYSPLIVIIWTVAGLVIVLVASRTGKEEWLMKAGESAQLRPETPTELAHRPAL
jgi:amino acid transporter